MKTKTIRLLAFSCLLTVSLGAASPVLARDYWHWSKDHNRWDRRADLRSDYHDLEQAKRQLDYDRRHHASRKKIAEDEARVRDIERDIQGDRRARRYELVPQVFRVAHTESLSECHPATGQHHARI